jgi:hypothetical protein
MNWKECGREWSWNMLCIVLLRYPDGRNQGNNDTPLSVYPIHRNAETKQEIKPFACDVRNKTLLITMQAGKCYSKLISRIEETMRN